jgi:hypothetical protein
LSGEAQRIAESRGISGWLVSISHTASLAQASVIGTGIATGPATGSGNAGSIA